MKKVLIQEPDRYILDVLKIALELENFSVYSVECLDSSFLNQIELLRPHVVLLDCAINSADCAEICRQIKELYPHLPVIALSCNNNIHEEYDKHGFDDYIKKPFDLEVLYSILRKHIID